MLKYDLEDRLIKFAVHIYELTQGISNSEVGKHLHQQILRSSISPALNYGEAQGAESDKDFIHKLSLVIKELRETRVCLKLISAFKLNVDPTSLPTALKENDELIAIFVSSIKTRRNSGLLH